LLRAGGEKNLLSLSKELRLSDKIVDMDDEAELRQQFVVWLENCRLRLAIADSREQLRTEMVEIARLLAVPTEETSGMRPRKIDGA